MSLATSPKSHRRRGGTLPYEWIEALTVDCGVQSLRRDAYWGEVRDTNPSPGHHRAMTQPPQQPHIDGVTVVPEFIENHAALYDWCVANIAWDDRIQARKTASCGVPYNYAGLDYPRAPFPPLIEAVRAKIAGVIGFDANNCLLNWYPDGRSRMGFHADSAAGLAPDSGVAIVSLGAPRTLRFRRTASPDERLDYPLVPGELLFMEKRVQDEWQHAVPRNSKPVGRISLTFRIVEG